MWNETMNILLDLARRSHKRLVTGISPKKLKLHFLFRRLDIYFGKYLFKVSDKETGTTLFQCLYSGLSADIYTMSL